MLMQWKVPKFDQLVLDAGLVKPLESTVPKLRLKSDEEAPLIAEAPVPVKKVTQSRWKYAKTSFKEFFRKRKWLIPFYFLTAGILPLAVLIVYLCKYKKQR